MSASGLIVADSAAKPSPCGCGLGANPRPLVFVLGAIDVDLVSEARRISILQHMGGDPDNLGDLLCYFGTYPWEAASVTWVLRVEGVPIYAVRPTGPFAADVYGVLRGFLQDELDPAHPEEPARVAIAGRISGSVTLRSGQVVPMIEPEPRGMFSWKTGCVLAELFKTSDNADELRRAVAEFLQLVYAGFRNFGLRPEDRALNYAASNILQIANLFGTLFRSDIMEFDTIEIEGSPMRPQGSDWFDVTLFFSDPSRAGNSSRLIHRFTVDVSDVVPVMVGSAQSWTSR